jgi:hypothetical protein
LCAVDIQIQWVHIAFSCTHLQRTEGKVEAPRPALTKPISRKETDYG